MIRSIAAVNALGFIGKDGKLMWKSTEDFKHFKTMTKNSICIVGKTTFEIDLGGKALPGREMIVVGKEYNRLQEAIDKAKRLQEETNKDIWIIGGQSIYEQLMDITDEFHLSIIEDDFQIGDRTLTIPTNFKGKLKIYTFQTDKQKQDEN